MENPSPLRDERAPFTGSEGHPQGRTPWVTVVLALLLGTVSTGFLAFYLTRDRSAGTVEVRPTPSMLVAIQDLSRLECTEVHVEKVIDLSDKQKILGWVETEDALLLVASGSAIVGVDFEKLRPGDVSFDETTKTARLKLPSPELLSSRLDPDATYVYKRSTGLLAERNEQLESRGRKEAIVAIEKVANSSDTMTRAKRQAERQLTSLLKELGAKNVEITWR